MGKIDTFCDLMYKWCCEMDMHYGQGNKKYPLPRYDFRYGGSTDCSGMVGYCMEEAGFDGATPTWWTGNLWECLDGKGWIRVEPDGNPQRGDILLNEVHHVGIWDGSHVIEFGGDPHLGYSAYHGYYTYWAGWDCYLRYVEGDLDMASAQEIIDILNDTSDPTGREKHLTEREHVKWIAAAQEKQGQQILDMQRKLDTIIAKLP